MPLWVGYDDVCVIVCMFAGKCVYLFLHGNASVAGACTLSGSMCTHEWTRSNGLVWLQNCMQEKKLIVSADKCPCLTVLRLENKTVIDAFIWRIINPNETKFYFHVWCSYESSKCHGGPCSVTFEIVCVSVSGSGPCWRIQYNVCFCFSSNSIKSLPLLWPLYSNSISGLKPSRFPGQNECLY